MATLSTSIATGITLASTGTHASPFTITTTGIVNAAAPAGTYAATLFPERHQAETLTAAAIGHTAALTLLNNGLIETTGTHPTLDYGIVFGAAGLITNAGTILGPGDIALFAATGTPTIKNTGLLEATAGSAILFDASSGSLLNSGRITAIYSGIYATGGAVTNAAGGYIAGNAAVNLDGASLTNAGTLHGSTYGISDFASGRLTNTAGGIITGIYGIQARNSAGAITLSNAGTIRGSALALQLLGGGVVTNASAALLQTTSNLSGTALLLKSGGTVLNAGTITAGAGILLNSYGTISLASYARNSGTIAALGTAALVTTFSTNNSPGDAGVGIALNLPGSVLNAGLISATTAGILSLAGGSVTNAITGKILGAGDGLDLKGGAALNQGAITAATYGVYATGGASLTNATGGMITTSNPLTGTAIVLTQGGTVLNTGTLAAGAGAVFSAYGTLPRLGNIYNSGIIRALGTATLGDSGIGIAMNLAGIAVNAGFITATSAGILSTGAAVITNSASGTISAPNGITSTITAPSTIGNAGLIIASENGIYIANAATVSNSGIIFGTGGTLEQGSAIHIAAGTVNNSGIIAFLGYGIQETAGTVTNTGVINTYLGRDITVKSGSIVNAGQLSGRFGAEVINSGAITNSGDVSVTDAALAGGAGSITNTGFAAGNFAALMQGPGIVINAGTLIGANAAVYFYPGNNNTLIAEPGALFIGAVQGGDSIGGAGISLLELGAGQSMGKLPGFGSQFTDFQTLAFAPGASWCVYGSLSAFAAGLSITGLAPADTLDIGASLSGITTIGAGGLLAVTANHVTQEITFAAADAGEKISFRLDGRGGTQITTGVACFCRGTRIATPHGNIAIENLNIGDWVRTMHGPQKIRWIGRRDYAAPFIRNNPDALPIRIRRHAIAFNVPSRDLYVSPDHAIAEGGVLIHAHLLLNGISFHQPRTAADVEYFHLEFDAHTLLFTENFSVESFIDEGAGNRFQNAETRPASTPGQKPCLPRVFDGFHLHNIKSRIAARAGIKAPRSLGPLRGVIDEVTPTLIRGWAQNSAAPEHPVTLEIISSGYHHVILANAFRPDLRDAGIGSGCHGFSLTLPNLSAPVTIRRLPDGAPLQNTPTRRMG